MKRKLNEEEAKLPSPKRRKIQEKNKELQNLKIEFRKKRKENKQCNQEISQIKLKMKLAKRERLRLMYNKYYGNDDVFNRLISSDWPSGNGDDFVFLKNPFTGKEFPCDEKVCHIVEFLWENKINTVFSDQPAKNEIGSIMIWGITSDQEETMKRIKEVLQEKVEIVTESKCSCGRRSTPKRLIKENPKKFYYFPNTWMFQHNNDKMYFGDEALELIERHIMPKWENYKVP